jgi:hypothetical protein
MTALIVIGIVLYAAALTLATMLAQGSFTPWRAPDVRDVAISGVCLILLLVGMVCLTIGLNGEFTRP